MTEWSPGTAPTTEWDQEAGMLPSGENQPDNISDLVERAETAATNAETAETNAETAETGAETAQGLAETARDAAVVARTGAETAETNAETAQAAAETAQSAAETAQTAAETAETNAETAESNAETYASNALTSANNASSSATSASNAQSAAESARDATLAAYDQFDDRYLGAKASDPSVDNDGNALVGGALYFNTTDEAMKIYTGTQWQVAYANLATSSTDDLSEGSTNLYYTTARANAAIDARVDKTFIDALNVDADTLDGIDSTGFATSTQGALADSALQSGDNISELTNDSGYLTSFTETNDLTAAVTWTNVPDANVTQSSVTQHQAALTIANTQVTGLGTAATTDSTDYATAAQGALADTATQPGDLGTAAALDVGTGANNVVQLDGTGALPAVDGSNLTNVSSVATLNDLTDVDTTGVTDGQVIAYNETSGNWEAADQSASGGTFTTYNYTATSGQTVFTGADDNANSLLIDSTNNILVTLNGITLENGTDYTATSSVVTLTSGATTDDELNIYAFGSFDVADYTQFPFFKSSGAAANIDLTGFNSIRFFKADGTASNIALG